MGPPYWKWPQSRRSEFETEKYIRKILKCLKSGIKHSLVLFYQVSTDEDPGVQNNPKRWDPGSEP